MAQRRSGAPSKLPAIEMVVETPKESRIKFKYAPTTRAFEIDRILPQGLRFPFNFGFVPNTQAPDGDPADVVLILDESLFPGCHVKCRIVGVIKAEQTEHGRTVRNDRIVAVALKDKAAPRTMADAGDDLLTDVERFFVTYHQAEGNRFKVLGTAGADKAVELLKAAATE